MRFAVLLLAAAASLSTVHALHFYLDANEKRCFIEELPTDTVVEGHYRALEWAEARQEYAVEPELGIIVEVEASIAILYPDLNLTYPISRKSIQAIPLLKQKARQRVASPSPRTRQETIHSAYRQTILLGSPTLIFGFILTSLLGQRHGTTTTTDHTYQKWLPKSATLM